MAKIKAGTVPTAGIESVTVEIENGTARGRFEIHMLGQKMTPEQSRQLADVLTSAADKAEIFEAAIGG
jgi:hypothetical protein